FNALIGLDILKPYEMLSRKNARKQCVTKHTDGAAAKKNALEISGRISVLPSSTDGARVASDGADFPTRKLNSRRTVQQRAETLPVEARTWIGLAPGSNVAVTGDIRDRVARPDRARERGKRGVLGIFERRAIRAFQLDADRE